MQALLSASSPHRHPCQRLPAPYRSWPLLAQLLLHTTTSQPLITTRVTPPIQEQFDAAQSAASSSISTSPAPASPAASSNSSSTPHTATAPLPLPVRCWFLRPVADWHRHTCPVLSLHVSTDCSVLYSGDSHGLVLQWSLSLYDEQHINVSGVTGVGVPSARCRLSVQSSGEWR